MEMDRDDGRTANQLRPLACSCNVLNRAYGSASWSQGLSVFHHLFLVLVSLVCEFVRFRELFL